MPLPPLGYISAFSFLIPAITGYAKFKVLDAGMRTLLALLTFYIAAVALQMYLAFHGMNNLWISSLSNLIELLFVAAIYTKWQKLDALKVQVSVGIFVFCWVITKLFLENLSQPEVYTSTASKAILCAISVYVLPGIVRESSTFLFRNGRLWIVAAILMLSAGDLLFYLFRDYIDKLALRELSLVYSEHWILVVVANLMYAGGFMCKPILNIPNADLGVAPPS